MSLPWFKFSPASWRGDEGLRAVSLAARGLWIECLCLMHQAKPYGHLTLNGTPVADETLARIAGAPVDEVRAMMAELRQAGVSSVTREGVVYSRRMTADHAKAQKGRKSVAKRWAQVTEAIAENASPNRSPNSLPNTKNTEERIPPKPPKGGARRASRGADVFLRKAREIEDGSERTETSPRGDRLDAGRIPQLAIEHQRGDG